MEGGQKERSAGMEMPNCRKAGNRRAKKVKKKLNCHQLHVKICPALRKSFTPKNLWRKDWLGQGNDVAPSSIDGARWWTKHSGKKTKRLIQLRRRSQFTEERERSIHSLIKMDSSTAMEKWTN